MTFSSRRRPDCDGRRSPHVARKPAPRCAAALAVAAVTAFGGASSAVAQTTFGGQVRPRFEIRSFDDDSHAFTSMRSRLHVSAAPAPDVRVFVQVQDVRLWGEESNTLGDFRADALDVHQAFVEAGHEGRSPLWLRVGRQEVSLGGQRLVGAVDWTQQARAFDGLRGAWTRGEARVDAFGFQLGEESAGALGDASFLGGVATLGLGAGRTLELYGLHDRAEDRNDMNRTTLGARYVGRTGPWSYRTEGYWQTGDVHALDVSAWMAGVRVGRTFAHGEAGATLWYDLLSGDGDLEDDEVGVFNTLYATNHKFYGYADLFLDIPAHTAGRGLQDAALKTFWDPAADVRLMLDLHHFRAAEDVGLSTGHFADELDLTAQWTYDPRVVLTGGLSWVLQGDALAEINRLDDDMLFGYVMLSTTF